LGTIGSALVGAVNPGKIFLALQLVTVILQYLQLYSQKCWLFTSFLIKVANQHFEYSVELSADIMQEKIVPWAIGFFGIAVASFLVVIFYHLISFLFCVDFC
jgi:hypothetical protein